MVKVVLLLGITVVALCVLGCESVSTKDAAAPPLLRDIAVVKDIRDFTKTHPNLKLMRLNKASGKARSNSVRYTLGARIDGDRLVAQGADVFNYPAKKDVTIQLTYPQSGTGSIVTYVEIVCSQDNGDGNAYVVAGGIGQRFISIVVEANQTEEFSYNAQYYGRD